MAVYNVYYKFKSGKNYDSIPIADHFISVRSLKERIFEKKRLGGTDFDLVVTNAQTNEEYLDEAMLIPKHTSVLIRRVGRPCMPIVMQPDKPKVETKIGDDQHVKGNFTATDSCILKDLEASDLEDEFGCDIYTTIPEVKPGQLSNTMQDTVPLSKADEDSKIKALIENSALDWHCKDGFGRGRGFGRGGRGDRGFGRGVLECKTPPPGYVCHRCKVPGHFIQHCATNGDPNYDIKKVKPPTVESDEDAFEKEIGGLLSTRSVGDFPPELHCPLCKEVMKDAMLTSKCCFTSFCDKCIRDYFISKKICVCGARDILTDDLVPNKTLRDTINRILESGNSSSGGKSGISFQDQDTESMRCPPPKIPSPTQSAGEQMRPPSAVQTPNLRKNVDICEATHESASVKENTSQGSALPLEEEVQEKMATHESASVKESISQGSALPLEEEVQQKMAACETGNKKKKKKKMPLPVNAPDMQWMGPSAFEPYWPWPGTQPAMNGFMGPFANTVPYKMGYGPGPGPMVMPFGNATPQDPVGTQCFMFPPIVPTPQRELAAEFGMGMNVRLPFMSKEEFEARKAELRRKREMERRVESRDREVPKDRGYGREVSNGVVVTPMKSKPKSPPVRRSPSEDRHNHGRDRRRERASLDRPTHRHRSDRISPHRSSGEPDLSRQTQSLTLKRKSDQIEYCIVERWK